MQRPALICRYCVAILFFTVSFSLFSDQDLVVSDDTFSVNVQPQHNPVVVGVRSSLAFHFNMKDDWHFYASAESAPGGMNLKLEVSSDEHIGFESPIFPAPRLYFDKATGTKLEVFSGDFMVYLPFTVERKPSGEYVSLKVQIDGAVCSDIQCRFPEVKPLIVNLKVTEDTAKLKPNFTLPEQQKPAILASRGILDKTLGYTVWYAIGLAVLAGLSLNIMPCVWPVLPIVILRIVEQARISKRSRITVGFAFCVGILLFFALLAAANVVLRLVYDTALQWGDQLRSPVFVTVMALVFIVLALFMFDVFTITLPQSISAKQASTSRGFLGTVGMGFLAAILSTPCSFGILAAAFAWAQAQPLLTATVVIMCIGIGMAVPYLILSLTPGLLERLPKPGKWLDIFKNTVGFVLLGIAVWMITIITQPKRSGLMYYSVILAFCTWMWGNWVGLDSRLISKIVVRSLAVILAICSGYWLLRQSPELIDWQKYDDQLIKTSLAQNKPVLLKFTADWCLSCKVVDKFVYSRRDIAELIKQKDVVAIKADTTVRNLPATRALKNVYNEPGVPVSILLLPDGTQKRWRNKDFAEELKEALMKL